MAVLDKSRILGPEVLLQLAGIDTPTRRCILLGIEHGKIHIRAEKWIEPSSHVNATFARFTLSGEVVYCTRKDTWYRICIAIASRNDEARREPRLPVRLPGTVVALSDKGSESTQGTLLDVSVSGMRLETLHLLETGTMVLVQMTSILVAGEVRNCHAKRNGRFEAGIEITDILSHMESPRNSTGVLKRIRRKLAEAILGEPIANGS